jgi:hypothetical protein
MANNSTADSPYLTQLEAFAAELDLAFNFAKFAAVATDPELARYVHGKAHESYRRLAKLSSQSPPTERAHDALHTLLQRLEDFQQGPGPSKPAKPF